MRQIKHRRHGGGRKPQGEIAGLNSFTGLRMPLDMRMKIEKAAEKSRRSMSQEILVRLYESFENVKTVVIRKTIEGRTNGNKT